MKPFSFRDDLWKILLVVAVLVVAAVGSGLRGTPDSLPGAAMSWPLLFHIERGVLLLGVPDAAVFVGWRAFRGEFPRRLGGIEYPAREADADSSDALSAHKRRIELLEEAVLRAPSAVGKGDRLSIRGAHVTDKKPKQESAPERDSRRQERELPAEVLELRKQSKRALRSLQRIVQGK